MSVEQLQIPSRETHEGYERVYHLADPAKQEALFNEDLEQAHYQPALVKYGNDVIEMWAEKYASDWSGRNIRNHSLYAFLDVPQVTYPGYESRVVMGLDVAPEEVFTACLNRELPLYVEQWKALKDVLSEKYSPELAEEIVDTPLHGTELLETRNSSLSWLFEIQDGEQIREEIFNHLHQPIREYIDSWQRLDEYMMHGNAQTGENREVIIPYSADWYAAVPTGY